MNKKNQITKIKKKYKPYFDLARKTILLSKNILNIIGENLNNYPKGAKRVCSGLYTQTARLIESIVLLCNNGFDEEAFILTRSLLENVTYLLYIGEEESEERTEHYLHSRSLSSSQAVEEFMTMRPEKEEKINSKHYEDRKKEALEYFRKKHGSSKTEKDIRTKYTLRSRPASQQIKDPGIKEIFRTTYGMLYRSLSSVAHAEAPLRFIENKPNGISLKKFSTGKLTKMCLQTSMLFTLCTIESIIKLLEIKKKFRVQHKIKQLFELIDS